MQQELPRLTARQKEVIELVSQGLSSKEVARQLDIGFTTVEQYLIQIRRRLKAKNKTHAVYLAMQYGLINSQTTDVN